ncbi:hypothetical protein Enr13x_12570 [Stieleria neptunia]|uniref:Uncharacterized protein n=1 Tax=Stieleria neptunia TaxID=2527979 RepID=A0A518HKQ4_9BACT|nr:hypothetical protein [Stieleria neptunia]QDV41418.1 hypothetical protein Enr13x_12570 [Stieleria neptunia]
MTDFEAAAQCTIDHNRRLWASRRFLAEQAAAHLDDAAAILAEIDDEWEAMENNHARLRHHVRRLQQKLATDDKPLSVGERFDIITRKK